MFNDELSEIFSEMADIEEIEGKRWESLAYRKVSGNIAALGEDIREIYRRARGSHITLIQVTLF